MGDGHGNQIELEPCFSLKRTELNELKLFD